MYAAIIAVALVVAAIVGAFMWFGGKVFSLGRELADARVHDERKASTIALQAAHLETEKARGDMEQRRADALDEELDHVAEDGDVAGARERVLARYRRQAGGGAVPAPDQDPDAVHVDTPAAAVAPVDRDGLEQPGG